jgi:hypothetical protein
MRFSNDILLGLLAGIPLLAAIDQGVPEVDAGPIAFACVDTRQCCGNDLHRNERCDANSTGCIFAGTPHTSCKAELNSYNNCD